MFGALRFQGFEAWASGAFRVSALLCFRSLGDFGSIDDTCEGSPRTKS